MRFKVKVFGCKKVYCHANIENIRDCSLFKITHLFFFAIGQPYFCKKCLSRKLFAWYLMVWTKHKNEGLKRNVVVGYIPLPSYFFVFTLLVCLLSTPYSLFTIFMSTPHSLFTIFMSTPYSLLTIFMSTPHSLLTIFMTTPHNLFTIFMSTPHSLFTIFMSTPTAFLLYLCPLPHSLLTIFYSSYLYYKFL